MQHCLLARLSFQLNIADSVLCTVYCKSQYYTVTENNIKCLERREKKPGETVEK